MDYQRPNHLETPEEQARIQHSEWQYLKIFVVVVVAIVLVAAISFGMQVNKSMGELASERPAAAPAQTAQKPATAPASPNPVSATAAADTAQPAPAVTEIWSQFHPVRTLPDKSTCARCGKTGSGCGG